MIRRVTAHPGNVNGDSTAGAVDILALIDCLNGIDESRNCPWGDASRGHQSQRGVRPGRHLGLIDLLNGAGAFDVWLGTDLTDTAPCG